MVRYTNTKVISLSQALIFAASFVLLISPIVALAQPQEAQELAMQKCHYLQKVLGKSGYGHNEDWIKQAKINALGHAAKLGATHIVWEQSYTASDYSGSTSAKAYKCNP